MKAKALKKYIRSSPRKMRLVIDLIRGKKIQEALNILRFTNQLAAKSAEMTLRSAISNLNNKADSAETSIHEDDVFVSAVFVNQGPTMKRIQPAPMGRAFRVRKRSNHLTIEVSDGKPELNSENEEIIES
jgi:large subunit ribosomal protein L22